MKRLHTAGIGLLVIVGVFLGTAAAWAGIPEPDVVYYGTARYGTDYAAEGQEVTLVLDADSIQVAAYTMGANTDYVDDSGVMYYVLKVPMDALASIEGRAAGFYVDGSLAGRAQIAPRGSVVDLDLDTLTYNDSDNDGLDDTWEMQQLGTLQLGPNDDINGDGIDNLEHQSSKTDPAQPVWIYDDLSDIRETCVFHPLVLQKALAQAQSDGYHNHIKLQGATYAGNFSYEAAWGEDYDLAIAGGYDDGCLAVGASLTVLDGDADGDGSGDGTVLALDTAAGQTSGNIRVENLYLTGGSAAEGGGLAVVTDTGNVTLVNNIVVDNTAADFGGGISLRAQGAVQTLLVANNTIDFNVGGGIHSNSAVTAPVVVNNIITDSSGGEGIRAEGNSVPYSDYNNIWSNAGGAYNDPAFQGEHDISADPLFVDAAAGDFSLQAASPCIDTGTNETWLPDFDILGNARIMDGDENDTYRADMGAYELTADAPPGACQPHTDEDCDGEVDGTDQCPGFDDAVDDDGDGVPNGCDRCPTIDDLEDNDGGVGDGMPDCWEDLHGLDYNDPSDAGQDSDTDDSGSPKPDGFSNLQEYLAGTDPTDPDSHPVNQAPTVPQPVSPPNQSAVGTEWPTLTVNNALDDDLIPPTYEFEVYAADDMTTPAAASGDESEGDNSTTSWQVGEQLDENGIYKWRVRAKDNENDTSAWSNFFTFFVNTVNEPPPAPSLISPQDGEEVTTPLSTLVVGNATDVDHDALIYRFEIDTVETFDSPALDQSDDIEEEADGTTFWAPSALDENTTYYWRARACDADGCGDWMSAAAFRVNSVNDPPTIPQISAPPDGSELPSFQPLLEVTNAADADGDRLTYEFQLYADNVMATRISSAAGILQEWDGTTAWQVDEVLQNNRTYWWRARAQDDKEQAGGWSALYSFRVNTTNKPPSVPVILTPIDGMVIQTLEPSLVISNAGDDNLDPISYYFDIDKVNTFNSTALQRSARLPEGVGGITAWRPPSPLTDGMAYFWRVIAYDGESYSPWTTGSFAVNLANDLPTAPSLNSPLTGAEVTTFKPELEVNNATDLDGDSLSYRFEIDRAASFSSPALEQSGDILEGVGNTTSWTPTSQLVENILYYWRARACDPQGCGAWMMAASFRVNTINDLPSVPDISAPPDGSEVTSRQPVLEVTNAADADEDPLTYEFELYEDEAMTMLIAFTAGIPQEGDGTTAWKVNLSLDDGTAYWWRAQAKDDEQDGESGWSALFSFTVNTTNRPPSATTIVTPPDGTQVQTLGPSLVINNATDPNLDPITYYFEIDTVNTFNSAAIQRSPWVSEGLGDMTSWRPSQPLADNTNYHWRVIAYDGASYNEWTTGSFFVNLGNDLPMTPTPNNPQDGQQVQTLQPSLVVNNATDPDQEVLAYWFQLDKVPGFDGGTNQAPLLASPEISQGAGDTTSWAPSSDLEENTTYYWRVKACDTQGCGLFMTTASFLVNAVNDPPSEPNVSVPPDGAQVAVLQPVLEVTNAADADGDPLTYEFQLCADDAMTDLVASAFGILQQWDGTTAWQVDKALQNGQTYWWQAQARDDSGQPGGWGTPVSFTVNTANNAPTEPGIVTPLHNAQVQALNPSLVIDNATDEDLDPVTYYFDIDRTATFDSPALQRSARIPQGALGMTAWRPPLPLTDGATYYWRIIAYDGTAYSSWTTRSFTVNLANDPPTVPIINAPAVGADVETLAPSLVIENSTDANRDPIAYYFEIDTVDTYDSTARQQSPTVPQGAGEVTSWYPADLTDNTTYHWRVIAYDGASYSANWAGGWFFVNLANDPPGTPTVQSPAPGDEVAALSPVLQVNEAEDVYGDDLTYDYEVYADPDGTMLVKSIEGAGPAWPVDAGLSDNSFYWWRFRAKDDEGEPSPWSSLFVFFVNTVNDAPSAPSINRPQFGREVATRLPVLEVNNSTDVDRDTLTYEFEIDTVGTFNSGALQFEALAQGGPNTTCWSPWALTDHTTYYWRARACDADSCSEWMPRAEFFVNTLNETPVIPNLSAPPDGSAVTSTRPTLEVTNAANPDGDLLTYEFEVYDDKDRWKAGITGVLEETDGTTAWRVNRKLKHRHTYWWRVQARDREGQSSGWSDWFAFELDTKNDTPDVPPIVYPPDGGEVAALAPALEVGNATDGDRDTMTYWFEIDKKNTFDSLSLRQSDEIPEGAGHTTAWQPPELADNTTYYW